MGLLFLNLMLNQFFLSTCFFTTLFIPVVWRFSYLSYDWGKEIWAYGFLRMLFKFPFNIHLFLVNRIHVNGTSTNTNCHNISTRRQFSRREPWIETNKHCQFFQFLLLCRKYLIMGWFADVLNCWIFKILRNISFYFQAAVSVLLASQFSTLKKKIKIDGT